MRSLSEHSAVSHHFLDVSRGEPFDVAGNNAPRRTPHRTGL